MKKNFALLLIFGACVMSAQAQVFKPTAYNPTSAILNTNLDTLTVVVPQAYSAVAIQPIITKASGTMAGTAVLYSSLNGTNFAPTGDTLTLTNVTVNTKVWEKTNTAVTYYRIIRSGGTTVTGTSAALFSGKKNY